MFVAGAGLAVLLVLRGQPPQRSHAAPPGRTNGPTSADLKAITDGLASGDPARVEEVVALPPDQPIDPAAVQSLAAMAVTIDPESFRPVTDDGRTGTATALVTGADGATSPWTVTLIEDGTWQLVISEPQQ